MKKTYDINKEELVSLLNKAFDEGWGSYKDLKETVVEKLVQDFCEEKKDKEVVTEFLKTTSPPISNFEVTDFDELNGRAITWGENTWAGTTIQGSDEITFTTSGSSGDSIGIVSQTFDLPLGSGNSITYNNTGE